MAEKYVDIPSLSALQRLVGATADAVLDPEFFARTGAYVRSTVEVRTLAGRDADEAPFKPYSPKYALLRLIHGVQIDHVDLMWSGQMFNQMTHSVGTDWVRVYFLATAARDPVTGGDAGVTNAAKAYFNHQRRPFFALSTPQVSEIVRDYGEVLRSAMEGKRGVQQ